jgi:hypothetical protein
VYFRHIWAEHGMPEEIISDRDKLFTSRFWESLMKLIGTKRKLSTAFHPQTDGQTERINQELEQYLRHYVDYRQTNWVHLLPVAQFAWNSASSATLGVSPFYANYGLEPLPFRESAEITSIHEKARTEVEQLTTLHRQLILDIEFFRRKSADYYNKKRTGGPELKKGDKVYLLRRNIKTKRPSDKLDHLRLGPFEITEVKGPVTFKLKLPKEMRIHPTFHISLLEKAPKGTKTIIPEIVQDEQEYEVEKIEAYDERGNEPYYLVKWKGFGKEDNTWEPLTGLSSARQAVSHFHREAGPSIPSPQDWKTRHYRPAKTWRIGDWDWGLRLGRYDQKKEHRWIPGEPSTRPPL